MLSSFFLSGLIVKKRIRKNKHEMLDEAVKLFIFKKSQQKEKFKKKVFC